MEFFNKEKAFAKSKSHKDKPDGFKSEGHPKAYAYVTVRDHSFLAIKHCTMDFAIEQDDTLISSTSKAEVKDTKVDADKGTPATRGHKREDASGKSAGEATNEIIGETAGEVTGEDVNVNKYFDELEDKVTQQYEKTSNVLKKIVKERDDGIELNLGLDPETSAKAQEYIQKLDENLQSVEKLAQSYWSKMSVSVSKSVTESLSTGKAAIEKVQKENNAGSFWSSWKPMLSGVIGSEDEPSTQKDLSVGAMGGNRTELELRMLETDKSIYTNNKLPLDKEFDADSKTVEIANLIRTNKDLEKMMNELVPKEVPYADFWNIYFTHQKRILEMEERRKRILEEKLKNDDNADEEVAWDDDEDEGITAPAADAEHQSIKEKKISETKSEQPVEKQPKEVKEAVTIPAVAGDDDDEDDWE